MDRRNFLKGLVLTSVGLYVPKTLYFDMKPKTALMEPVIIQLIRRPLPPLPVFEQARWFCGLKENQDECVTVTFRYTDQYGRIIFSEP